MIDDLDAVDWSRLEHAYGSAEDVPGLLRDLAGGDREALSTLYGNIWHQGTIYEATGHAVPFLVHMLDLPSADPGDVLGLLTSIAEGTSYHAVHQRLLPRSERDSDEVAEQIETEAGHVAAAVRAVAAGLPVYLRLLGSHPDDDVRAAAAHLIGTIGAGASAAGVSAAGASAVSSSGGGSASAGVSAAGSSSTELLRAAADDPAEVVRAAAVLSSYPFGVPVTGSLTDRAPLPRLAAAIITIERGDGDFEALTAIIERDAPACLGTIGSLPSGAEEGLSWVAAAVAPRWDVVVRLLTAWLHHPGPAVREAAAHGVEVPLSSWRPAAVALEPALVEAARDPVEVVRDLALRHLAVAGRAPDLLWAAVERGPATARPRGFFFEPDLGDVALTVLARRHDPRADVHLAGLLRDGTARRDGLGAAVDALGPWAVACRRVILGAVEAASPGYDRAWLIRAAGRLALSDAGRVGVPDAGRVGVPDAGRVGVPVADLVSVLRRELAGHPQSAGMVLAGLGPEAAAARPELVALRASGDADRQLTAAYALWRITGDIDDLLALSRTHIREPWALELLARVGPAAAGLADLLPALFDDDHEWRVIHAAVAYWHLTGDAEPVVPVLIRLVAPIPWGVLAVRALGDIGPAASAAAGVLQEHAESPYRQAGTIAEDDGWAAICGHALARTRGEDPGDWPDVTVPLAATRS
jgi:hypothetical protein